MLCCREVVDDDMLQRILDHFGTVYLTRKMDGVRVRVLHGDEGVKAYSRTNLEIPNGVLQMWAEETFEDGFALDGELTLDNASFNATQSWVMSQNPMVKKFKYNIFDIVPRSRFATTAKYLNRIETLRKHYKVRLDCTRLLFPREATTVEAIRAEYDRIISEGGEGLIIRGDTLYKHGRSTFSDGFFRMVEWRNGKAIIIGFIEAQSNENEATISATGHTKRSKSKDNLHPSGTLGALVVRDTLTGIQFEIGTGWTHEQAQEIWDNKSDYAESLIHYKYKPFGVKDAPRQPVWLGSVLTL